MALTTTPNVSALDKTGGGGVSGFVTLTEGTNITITRSGQAITINSSGGGGGVTSAIGTANQVNVSAATGAVTFSTPQDIATTSSPTFGGIKLSGAGGTFTFKANSSTINTLEDITSDAAGGTFQSLLESHTSTGATAPTIAHIKSSGSAASPSISAINDAIGFHNFYGYTGNSTVGYQQAVQVQYWICADGTTVSTTSMPGRFQIFTTPDLSITPAERLRINCTGTISLFGPLQMDGNSVFGNTSSSGNLILAANTSTYDPANTGRITIKERITFSEAVTTSAAYNGALITCALTNVTSNSSYVFSGFVWNPTTEYSVSQTASVSPAFTANPIFKPTTNGLSDSAGTVIWSGFSAAPKYIPKGTGVSATTNDVVSYQAYAASTLDGATAGTVVNMTSFGSYAPQNAITEFVAPPCGTSTTWTNMRHLWAKQPSGSGTITNQIGVDIENLTNGGTIICGVRSAITAASTKYFLNDTGGAQSSFAGKFTKYNNITTVNRGIPSLVATIDLNAQSTALGPATLYALPASTGGTYRISWVATVTRAATTSSILGGAGGFQIIYVDADTGVTKTMPGTIVAGIETNSTNSTATGTISGCYVANIQASSTLQYQIGYTSVGVTAMQYNLHITVEPC